MLGKRFSFKVQKKFIFTETFNLKWWNARFWVFLAKLLLQQQKKVVVYWLKLINIIVLVKFYGILIKNQC